MPPPALSELYRRVRERGRATDRFRAVAIILALGAVLQAASVPASLWIAKSSIELAANRGISWPEFFDAINTAGHGWLFTEMVLVQIVLAVNAAGGGFKALAGRRLPLLFMFPSGLFAALFSFMVFGGFLGIFGGIATVAGGLYGFHLRRAERLVSVFPPG